MSQTSETGVSVIICCHNSSHRIIATLSALSKQIFRSAISWEIILVDNASTDGTSIVAIAEWEKLNTEIDLLIVAEPRPGLGFARKRGIYQARYSIVLFCDDDNWLYPDYVQIAYDILNNNPGLGACGGLGIPVFETGQPEWFNEYAEAFAVGEQKMNAENNEILHLYGAGLVIQKKIIHELKLLQFSPLLQGRVGKKLNSSEDTELMYAFVLMGYGLHYSEDLKFQHYLPKERLTFKYLKNLFAAFGEDGPIRNLYYAHISKRFIHRNLKSWFFHLLLSLVRLVKYFIVPPKKMGRSIYLNWSIAYIRKLLAIRRNYDKLNQNISALKKTEKMILSETFKQLA